APFPGRQRGSFRPRGRPTGKERAPSVPAREAQPVLSWESSLAVGELGNGQQVKLGPDSTSPDSSLQASYGRRDPAARAILPAGPGRKSTSKRFGGVEHEHAAISLPFGDLQLPDLAALVGIEPFPALLLHDPIELPGPSHVEDD